MKLFLITLAVAAGLSTKAGAQEPTPSMLASIRFADSTQRETIRIVIQGQLFSSLGFAKGDTGTLFLSDSTGTATGTLRAELSELPGRLLFSVPFNGPELVLNVWPISGAAVPRYSARGRTVEIYRSADGVLVARSRR
jgi:hypothetical protein